ncbi:MAG: helix-turn-helix domain-containing protein [Bariatricus sp.]
MEGTNLNYNLLKRLRKSQGYTQADVAEIIGVSRQTFSNYERGLREPALKVLVTLANFYGVSLDELVKR